MPSANGRDRPVLRAGLALLAVMLVGFKAVPAYSVALAELSERERALQEQVASLRSWRSADDSVVLRGLRALRDTLGHGLLRSSSTGGASGELASWVSDVAARSQVDVEAIVPEADSADDRSFSVVRVRGEGWASVGTLATFLDIVENGDRVARVGDLQITASNPEVGEDQPERLRLRFTIEGLASVRPDRK